MLNFLKKLFLKKTDYSKIGWSEITDVPDWALKALQEKINHVPIGSFATVTGKTFYYSLRLETSENHFIWHYYRKKRSK